MPWKGGLNKCSICYESEVWDFEINRCVGARCCAVVVVAEWESEMGRFSGAYLLSELSHIIVLIV